LRMASSSRKPHDHCKGSADTAQVGSERQELVHDEEETCLDTWLQWKLWAFKLRMASSSRKLHDHCKRSADTIQVGSERQDLVDDEEETSLDTGVMGQQEFVKRKRTVDLLPPVSFA
ncbi:hypothetical protein S83_065761, partial [Arachis hypogaea]